MDEILGALVAFLVIAVVAGFVIYLVVTFIIAYWAWIIVVLLGAGALGAVFLFWVSLDADSAPSTVKSEHDRKEAAVAVRAAVKEREQVVAARIKLEQSSQALNRLRVSATANIGFQVLVQRHHESRLLADSWYQHKRNAEQSEKSLQRSISALSRNKDLLSKSASTSSVVRAEITATTTAIDGLRQNLTLLTAEVRRGRAALDQHNIATGKLRDYIRDNCGARGQKWYADMQARRALRGR